MSDVTAVRGQLTDAMIDQIVISMTGKQRVSALREALARVRDLEERLGSALAENVELRERLEAAEGRVAELEEEQQERECWENYGGGGL